MTPRHWQKLWSVLLASSLWLTPGLAYAGEKHCDPEDAKSCVQALTTDEPAPFPGQLMTHRRAATVVAKTEECNDLRSMDLEEAHELHQIQLSLLEDQKANDKAAADLKLDLTLKRMAQMEEELSPRWYERPPFVAAVTVVLTVAIFAAAVKTVEALK